MAPNFIHCADVLLSSSLESQAQICSPNSAKWTHCSKSNRPSISSWKGRILETILIRRSLTHGRPHEHSACLHAEPYSLFLKKLTTHSIPHGHTLKLSLVLHISEHLTIPTRTSSLTYPSVQPHHSDILPISPALTCFFEVGALKCEDVIKKRK